MVDDTTKNVEALVLSNYPNGFPDAQRDFKVVNVAVSTEVKDGEVLIKAKYLSMDPYMRGRMSKSQKGYISSFELNKPISGFGLGIVMKSKAAGYEEGDAVTTAVFPWQEYCILVPTPASVQRVPKADLDDFPLTYHIGVLGMPGMTAWLGLIKLCEPVEGETLFVSAAAGAVGQLVGQLGKLRGLRVVGSAGTDEKCKYLKDELHFDAVINYKKCASLREALKEACPNGIDCYFDNVGGETLDEALLLCNERARIAECGMISQYNNTGEAYGIKNLFRLIANNIRMEGFIVSNLMARFGTIECITELRLGLASGKLKYMEDIIKGNVAGLPEAYLRMLKGENHGKQIFEFI